MERESGQADESFISNYGEGLEEHVTMGNMPPFSFLPQYELESG